MSKFKMDNKCFSFFSETPKFGIVKPFPQNIYPLEFTSAQVTCVAFDGSGTYKPVKIVFERRDEFNSYVELKANDNLHFENRTEIVGEHMSHMY